MEKETTYRPAIRIIKIECAATRGVVLVGKIRTKIREVITFRSHVIVDNIQNNSHILLVTFIYQLFQFSNTAVAILGSVGIHPVISPIAASGYLRNGHDFYGINA